ncbi:4-oxalocrotonate tautomerase family protein [Streptomyces chartreusis]|uniref:tautomerase family protein n=1 Tax=Streptomyces chartreusis TaxID=1969 RepID=UPI00371D2809
MPIVNISVAAGRDPQALRSCLQAVHDAVRDSLNVPDTAVRVLLTEVPPALWSSGGVTLQERGGNSNPPVAGSPSS